MCNSLVPPKPTPCVSLRHPPAFHVAIKEDPLNHGHSSPHRRRRHAPTTARLRAVVPWRGTRFTPPRAEPKISHSTQAREPELTSLREIAI